MGLRLALGFISVACAVAACSGEVGTGDQGSPIQGHAGAAGTQATGTSGNHESGGAGQGSTGEGGASQAEGGSRAMGGASGTSSPGPAGSGGASSSADAGPSAASDIMATDADLQFCVDENNRYRATLTEGPLARSSTLEAFAATGAQVDYAARTAHSHFTTSKGIPGARASGENEIPGFGGWNLNGKNKTIHAIIAAGLLDMWNEGPGGGHYENIKSTKFTQMGCGVFVAANHDVTVTMDYTN